MCALAANQPAECVIFVTKMCVNPSHNRPYHKPCLCKSFWGTKGSKTLTNHASLVIRSMDQQWLALLPRNVLSTPRVILRLLNLWRRRRRKKSCQKALHTYHTNMKMQIMTKIMELTWLSRSFAFLISLLVEHLLHHKKSCTIDIRKSISASLARTSLTPRRSHSQSSGNMHLTLDVGFDDLKRMYP